MLKEGAGGWRGSERRSDSSSRRARRQRLHSTSTRARAFRLDLGPSLASSSVSCRRRGKCRAAHSSRFPVVLRCASWPDVIASPAGARPASPSQSLGRMGRDRQRGRWHLAALRRLVKGRSKVCPVVRTLESDPRRPPEPPFPRRRPPASPSTIPAPHQDSTGLRRGTLHSSRRNR